MAKLSAKLEKKIKAIDVQVTTLHFNWMYFTQLFSKAHRIEILSRTAHTLFGAIQDAMFSDIILTIARLTDPAKTSHQENLSIDSIIEELDRGELKTRLQTLSKKVRLTIKNMRVWRNKKLSHNDLQKSVGVSPLPDIPIRELSEALALIREVMNSIHRHFNNTTVMYELGVGDGDGNSLMFYLEYGLEAWNEDKANLNVERLHRLRKRWSKQQ